jgi:hypothetical protein
VNGLVDETEVEMFQTGKEEYQVQSAGLNNRQRE